MWLLVIGIVLFVLLPVATGFWLQHAAARQEEEARLLFDATNIAEVPELFEPRSPAERWPA